MPAIAAIAINDGKSTPVTHTFAPVTTNGQKARFANRSATIPQGFEVLQVEVREPQSGSGSYRIVGSLTLPTVAAVNAVDTVVRTSKVDFSFSMAQLSTAQDRLDAVTLMKNLFSNTTFISAVQNLEPYY